MQLPHILVLLAALFLADSGKPPAGDTWMVLSRHAKFCHVTWIPTAEQVLKARQTAKRHLEESLPRLKSSKEREDQYKLSNARIILKYFDSYRLQAGGQTKDGCRIICLNFVTTFGPETEQRWRKDERYIIMDSGSFNFWTVRYDPESDAILSWNTN